MNRYSGIAVFDSLGICKIPKFGMLLDFDLKAAAAVLSAFAGEEFAPELLMRIGERDCQSRWGWRN